MENFFQIVVNWERKGGIPVSLYTNNKWILLVVKALLLPINWQSSAVLIHPTP